MLSTKTQRGKMIQEIIQTFLVSWFMISSFLIYQLIKEGIILKKQIQKLKEEK